jgi:hypothetical protein
VSAHALLGGSTASRWINCPPSARLTEHIPNPSSEYAAEGTLAHEYGELLLRKHYTTDVKPSVFRKRVKEIQANSLYQPEMDDYVKGYLDFCKDVTVKNKSEPILSIEKRIDYSKYAPEGFGTADFLAVGDDTLWIVDLKYGKGVKVEAEGNSQLRLYALGALDAYSLWLPVEKVKTAIYQPRLDHISIAEYPVSELLEWGENVVKPAAERAWWGKGEFQAGSWCRWCLVRSTCRARAATLDELASTRVDPVLHSPEEIGKYLTLCGTAEAFIKDLREHACAELLNGAEIPGWKVVEGTGRREWTDQEKAFQAAIAADIPEALLYDRSPKTLAQLEKAVGKPTFAAVLSSFVAKAPGKPVLAVESDKRPAMSRLEDDFADMFSVTNN